MFSPELYDKLDPSYRQALSNLEPKLKDPAQRVGALMSFMKRYTVSQRFWLAISRTNCCQIRFVGMSPMELYFYFSSKSSVYGPLVKYYDICYMSQNVDLIHISYPCGDLTRRMEFYEKRVDSFIPPNVRRRYETMKVLYAKIKTAEGNVDEWFAALLEAHDHQFLCDSVEYTLGVDLYNKKLWKIYLAYLWECDFQRLLETFSKCVRFYTDDAQLMNKYREAAAQNGRLIPVPWINPYSFEVYDPKFWDTKAVQERRFENIHSATDPLTVTFDAATASKQKFSLPYSMINSIVASAGGKVLQKLFANCKWFRIQRPVNVCYKLQERTYYRHDFVEIKEQSVKSGNNSLLNSHLDKLYVTQVFDFYSPNQHSLSRTIPKIYQCVAKYVSFANQTLTLKEIQFLIAHAVDLLLSNIKNIDGKEFSLESILQSAPQIKAIQLNNVDCTPETSDQLRKLQLANKVASFVARNIKNQLLDPTSFGEFVKNNFGANAYIQLHFKNTNIPFGLQFRKIFGNVVKQKWGTKEEPNFHVR